MADELNRYRDNRIDLVQRALDQHLRNKSNPHAVKFADLVGVGEVEDKIISSIEAKFDENEQFCLYLYDYNGVQIGEPIPIDAESVAEWSTLMGDPKSNNAILPYLNRIDLSSDGIGYTIIPEFEEGPYNFKETYDLATLEVVSEEDKLYEDQDHAVYVYTYGNYEDDGFNYKKCILFKTIDNGTPVTYCYFKFRSEYSMWYQRRNTSETTYEYYEVSDYSKLRFILDPKKILMDKEEILDEIIDFVEGE